MPHVTFVTLGCKVNQYETERIAARFAEAGFNVVPPSERADVCVVNTCSVTQVAEAKSRKSLRKLARLNPGAVVVVTGCDVEMARRVGRSFPEATLVVPNERKLDLLQEVLAVAPHLQSGESERAQSCIITPASATARTRAVVKVQDGCDMYCSFCSVPFTRGPVQSRPVDEVLAEVQQAVDAGRREIVLTGILLGAYGRDRNTTSLDLADLVEAVAQVAGVARVRLSSIEPTQVTERLLAVMSEKPSVCPHLHIPLQSGDDDVLRRMGRPYTATFYRQLCQKARERIPDLAITTDVLVGFPDETEDAHTNTVQVAREVGFARMHVFRYSPRPGTPAAEMSGQVDESVKERRCREMMAVASELRRRYAAGYLGKTLEVLAEPADTEGWLTGYTPNYIRVRFPAEGHQVGGLVPVLLQRLRGEVVEGRPVRHCVTI